MKRARKITKEKLIKNIVTGVLSAAVIFCAANFLSNVFMKNKDTENVAIVKEPETSQIELVMVGDNLLHMPVIKDAKTETGYNFDKIYEDMGSYFKEADAAVIVQETILGGSEFGYSGYPAFNSPHEVGDALANAGFNIIVSATNHSMDKGEKGILSALNFWKKYPEIKVLGIHESQEDYDTVDYFEKNGIKLALLNYTDSTNGYPVPKNYLISRYNKDKVTADITIAEQNADLTVVFMHWGTEYRFTADEGQMEKAKYLTGLGADLIIASHPHVVQPAEWVYSDNGNKSLVYYSLGNFVSRQMGAENLVGAMAKVKIVKDGEQGVYIEKASVIPTITHYNKNLKNFRVYPLNNYTDELASEHGVAQYDGKVSVERFKKIFDDVFVGNLAVNIE